jgi:hypothetical protein
MSNLNSAAEQAKQLSRQFKALIEVGEALEGFANIDNHRVELEAARDKARAEEKEAVLALVTVKAEFVEAQFALEDARVSASDLISDAKNQAEQIVRSAQSRSDAVDVEIETRKAEYRQFARDQDDAIDKRQSDADAAFEAQEEEYKRVRVARQSAADALEAHIDNLQRQLKNLRNRVGSEAAVDVVLRGEAPVVDEKGSLI